MRVTKKKLYNTEIGGSCGAGVYWALTDNQRVLHIYGNGNMKNCDSLWPQYASDIEKIIISPGVQSIGNGVFSGSWGWFSKVMTVVLPESATIKPYAFTGCSLLSDVYYLGSPESWDPESLADGNWPLTTATIHYLTAAGHCGDGVFWALERDGVLRIFGSGAVDDFAAGNAPWADYASQIAAVCVESGVSNVPAGTFSGCKNLVSASVAPGVQADGAFDGCALKMQSQIALLSQNEVRLHLAIAADTAVCAVIYDENGKMLACRCFAAGEAREEDAVLTSALAAGRVKLFTTDRGSAPAAPALTYEIPAEDAGT